MGSSLHEELEDDRSLPWHWEGHYDPPSVLRQNTGKSHQWRLDPLPTSAGIFLSGAFPPVL